MKLGIMQPYFFPYIGYWQLLNAVDAFVVYDNIQYSKGGWINRNRITLQGKEKWITIPLKKASDYLDIGERTISDSFCQGRVDMLQSIKRAYSKAPYFEAAFPVIERVINYDKENLFEYIFNSIEEIKSYLGIDTPLIVSSSLKGVEDLKAEARVLETCKVLGAKEYINPIGGVGLYSKENFAQSGISLRFLQARDVEYEEREAKQFSGMSIVEVMMYNSRDTIRELLTQFDLI